ncbi:MAG: hypothetical protein HC866_12160 [Leptolyngbyaceae cyanobacterium RU_5_1]|nr:hypothetical protein [Leptolyngbyaceae cyanobacterium RU_5_1]
MQDKSREDKQKVTLYLPQELHRQLKIRAAVDSETMTDIAQKAIVFYLSHPDVVDHYEVSYGQSHRVYSCPECSTHLVLHDGNVASLRSQPSVVVDENLPVESPHVLGVDSQGEESLVPC